MLANIVLILPCNINNNEVKKMNDIIVMQELIRENKLLKDKIAKIEDQAVQIKIAKSTDIIKALQVIYKTVKFIMSLKQILELLLRVQVLIMMLQIN